MGKCPNCGEWNSLVESIDSTRNNQSQISTNFKLEDLLKLKDVKGQQVARFSTGFVEFDRVLGGSTSARDGSPSRDGGIVPGSIILIAGDPGIGKSTLLLQTAMAIAGASQSQKSKSKVAEKLSTLHLDSDLEHSVLYVTGEESAHQVKIRADRLGGLLGNNLFVLPLTDVEAIVAASEKVKPSLLIIDSIQTLTTEKLSGSAGSVGQVRECAQILQRHAKSSHVPIFIVGHVTKEGNVAGPKVLEHLVDGVLNLEGENQHAFRLLRSVKNRFGSTFEVGVFEMTDEGMREVANPSEIFLAQRLSKRPGSVVCATIAGGRPLLVEVQALTTSTIFGMPTRRVTGLDFNRMQIVIAALTRAANLNLSNMDVYLNVAGGLKIAEPAADLAAALSIVSAALGKAIDESICAFGEVGLLGELRPVNGDKSRIAEAKRLGFGKIISPDQFKTLEQAIGEVIHGD